MPVAYASGSDPAREDERLLLFFHRNPVSLRDRVSLPRGAAQSPLPSGPAFCLNEAHVERTGVEAWSSPRMGATDGSPGRAKRARGRTTPFATKPPNGGGGASFVPPPPFGG